MDSIQKYAVIAFIIGTTDAICASIHALVFSNVLPSQVFKYVASGIFGAKAFDTDYTMVFWGLSFHFLIAILWTVIFLNFIFPIPYVRRNYIVSGCIFGLLMFSVMNFVVVPFSNTPPITSAFLPTLIMVIIHTFLGLLMAYLGTLFLKQYKNV